ncbi:transcription elongation factor GreA [Fluviispira multicolorata]|uniref:Transcription elongation factor GreA n=1 Tax=Fluviispira multicolorata TaxID=2654512 RepID=A0A833JE78_9BACT|nr:transcription elongation factor GreA [Fluviispira multicolorata]KAB8029795.1 transcription elongation factor GreA [Fluviispira multicolorata]
MSIDTNAPIPITQIGHEKLKEELKRLKTLDRPKVISEIAEARALGDLSENAEYHAAREKQGFIEGRIMELEDKLGRVQVITGGKGRTDRVVFGALVSLVDVSDDSKGEEKSYRIVGDLEADIKNNAISISSPLAKSLINKAVGDIVTVNLPRGEKYYEVKDIRFID